MNTFDLSGQVAVVTGGMGGIGLAIAKRAEACGATVSLWDTQTPDANTHAGHFAQVDVTSETSVTAACAKTVADLGRLDILVNCAGITGPTATVEDYTLSDWLKVLSLNLTGTFLCNRAVVSPMRQQNYGRIVNLASIAGKEGNALQSAYSASKAGVIALTKSLGKELCTYPITVNCIAPAMVETPLLMQMPPEKRRENLAKIPMGRAGSVAEIASLALWLASPECSFSTGATFDASGGRATY